MKKIIAFGIVVVFLCAGVVPSISGITQTDDRLKNNLVVEKIEAEKLVPLTLYFFEKTKIRTYNVLLSEGDAQEIAGQFEELKKQIATQPMSENTQVLQQDFINVLSEKGVIPKELSEEELVSLLTPPPITVQTHRRWNLFPFQNRASEWLCTYVSFGSGASFPIVILPRFIPFILTPIPRVFLRWNAKEGVTSCGGLASGTGFIAVGEQKGVALGFWGIGFTFSLPPLMNTYGMAGYALYATVTADYIEHYPPNSPPEITGADPIDGEENVTVSLSELRFRIEDADGDLMNYAITTEPDIGSGSGSLKSDGVYTIPVSDLQSYTEYTWHIQVDDGKDTVEQTQRFKTEPIEPIVSNPSPADGEREIPVDLPSLHFTVKDFQGDTMSYTVETSPDIGSGSGDGVHDGTYYIPVSGLVNATTFHWYVNITDGAHWTRKVFAFETKYPVQFNPFEFGWQYRKQITIDHTQVASDLTNFPTLLSMIDADVREKTQSNAYDILFMNNIGVATKLNHEIEYYDASSGELVVWVNISLLSSTSDTILYMYYGNDHCLSKENGPGTWDSHFLGVYHMSESYGSLIDSTGNRRNIPVGTTPTYRIAGKIGRAIQFDGTDDYFEKADYYDVSALTGLTMEVWFGITENWDESIWPHIVSLGKGKTTNNIGPRYAGMVGDGRLQMNSERDNGNQDCATTTGKYFSGWHYLAGHLTNEIIGLYVDGDTHITDAADGSDFNNFNDNYIEVGRTYRLDQEYMAGKIDEIRLSDIARDPTWIATTFNNQQNPSGFFSIGPEEPGP